MFILLNSSFKSILNTFKPIQPKLFQNKTLTFTIPLYTLHIKTLYSKVNKMLCTNTDQTTNGLEDV